jgi:hypothetical protein
VYDPTLNTQRSRLHGNLAHFGRAVVEKAGVRLVLVMDQRPVLRQVESGLPLNIAVQIGAWQPGVPVYEYVRLD